MDPTVLAAIIGAGATILVALLGMKPLTDVASYLTRRRQNIPDIMKTRWKAEWYYEDGSLCVNDTVTFSKWTRGSQFSGYGEVTYEDTNKQYRYSLTGEVAPNRIVVLTYKAEKYPLEASIGMACLELSDGAEKLAGSWAGRAHKKLPDGTSVYTVRSGAVRMQKVKDL